MLCNLTYSLQVGVQALLCKGSHSDDLWGFVGFQQLLRPIVAQLLVDAPPGLTNVDGDKDKDEGTATLEDMDGALVSCLGQMALTAGTDLLWKPLNHEVRSAYTVKVVQSAYRSFM
jgi:hypothetical protein